MVRAGESDGTGAIGVALPRVKEETLTNRSRMAGLGTLGDESVPGERRGEMTALETGFSRRRLLVRAASVGGGAAAASLLGPLAGSALGSERLVPRNRIGIQLFTVRTLAEADLPATLALLAGIGYREVEVAGLFGRTPDQFRALLDAHRLRAVGGHQLVGPALIPFFGERSVDDALDEAEALGQPYVGTAGITIPTGIVDGVGEGTDRGPLPRARGARQPMGRRGEGPPATALPACALLGVRHRPGDGRNAFPDPAR